MLFEISNFILRKKNRNCNFKKLIFFVFVQRIRRWNWFERRKWLSRTTRISRIRWLYWTKRYNEIIFLIISIHVILLSIDLNEQITFNFKYISNQVKLVMQLNHLLKQEVVDLFLHVIRKIFTFQIVHQIQIKCGKVIH